MIERGDKYINRTFAFKGKKKVRRTFFDKKMFIDKHFCDLSVDSYTLGCDALLHERKS